MPLTVSHKSPLPTANLLLRLNLSDTKFLLDRIIDAVQRGVGVNLVLEGLSSAICEIQTPERGKQVSVNAYSGDMTLRIETPMKGYNGPWSHCEIVLPFEKAMEALTAFVNHYKE